ncbi:hypothetical protein SAMN05660461_5324 [Chitinophaga ginsengisegetis]|uniref:DUF4890 domain-containing protein n=1 Tax=Chitinophaga ginsengisegetis TaxID=393003 RepID=A0A1T5P9U3_9BACT|nr:hypothetical protein [Chitinophaga ginsengisegetis]SKD09436.1 hypothetical protein SAMN05660461_5324 [Chitinophaga ginsengisegetis]
MRSSNTTKGIAAALTLLFVLVSLMAVAQNTSPMQGKTPQERAKFQTEMMKNKLDLDSAQVSQIDAINLEYAIRNEPILRGGDSKFSKFRQIKSLQKEKDAALKKVFTGEQYKQYQAIQLEMKTQLKEKRKDR